MLIDEKLIMEALNTALATGADFAEIFIEESLNNAVSAVDSKIDNVSSTIISGVGIRVYLGLRSVSATASGSAECCAGDCRFEAVASAFCA